MSKYRKRSRKFSYKNIVKRRRTQGDSDDENRNGTYPFIFQSFNVYILSVNIGAARRYVLANLICKYGGRVGYYVTDKTSHVLVDENITSAAVCQALEWTTYPPHISVVLVSWVSACIRANYCLDASDYELPCTHKPTFVSQHNRLILWRNQQKKSDSDIRETDCGSGDSNEMTCANADGEVSPFDDGLYEVDTSCDDSWLYEIMPHPILFDYLTPQCIKKADRSGSEQVNSSASKHSNQVCQGSPLRGFKRRRRDSRMFIQNRSTVATPAAKSNICPDGGTVSENKESINKSAISISASAVSSESVGDGKAKISTCSVEYTELKQSLPEGEGNSSSCSPLNLSKSLNSAELNKMMSKSSTTEVADTVSVQSSREISTATANGSLKAKNLSIDYSQSYQNTFKNEMTKDLTSQENPMTWKREYLKCEKLELDHKNSEHSQTSCSDVRASPVGYTNTFLNVSVMVSSSKICNSVSVEHSEVVPVNHEINNEELRAVEYKKQISMVTELAPQNLSLSKKKQNLNNEMSVSEKSVALKTFENCNSNFRLDDKVSSRKNYCKNSVSNLDELESFSGIKPLSNTITCFTEQRSSSKPKVEPKCESYAFPSTSSTNSLWRSSPSTSNSFFVADPSASNNSLCVAGPSTSNDSLCVAGPSTSDDSLCVAGPSTSYNSLCVARSSTSNNSFCVAGPSSSISDSLCIAGPSFSYSNSVCVAGSSKKKLFEKVKPKSTYLYSEHPNSLIIKKLQLLYDIFKRRKDNMRLHAYEKAIIALRKRKKAITSLEVTDHKLQCVHHCDVGKIGIHFEELCILSTSAAVALILALNFSESYSASHKQGALIELKKLRQKEAKSTNGIGRKIANKVWEIIQTGHLKEIDEISCNQRAKILRLFRAAWGINSLTADALYKEGHLTIQDLRTKSGLSRAHQIGLRYYDDLKLKMPRKEAEKILNLVMSVIFGLYSFVQCDACSSLRRNRQFCGHIEILVSLPEGHVNDHKILPEIVAKLHQDGYLIDDLVRHEENGAQTRYVGVIKLNTAGAKYRRISITVCNREEYACALMYLTGSAYFNKAVRQVAAKKNMVLDEHSLRRKTVTEDGLVYEVLPTPSEADIFLHLNIPFRVPEIRDRPLTLEAT